MLDSKQCSEKWKIICQIFDQARQGTPEETAQNIVNSIGINDSLEVLAVVSKLKEHDGRIYGNNRIRMSAIETDPIASDWVAGNYMRYANIDHIHPTHINQIITELLKIHDNPELNKEKKNKIYYKVMVNVPFGIDDTLYCEYSGFDYESYEEAEDELQKAENDPRVIYAKIEAFEQELVEPYSLFKAGDIVHLRHPKDCHVLIPDDKQYIDNKWMYGIDLADGQEIQFKLEDIESIERNKDKPIISEETEYTFEVSETYRKTIKVKATSEADAYKTLKDMYEDNKILMSKSDLFDADIRSFSDIKEPTKDQNIVVI